VYVRPCPDGITREGCYIKFSAQNEGKDGYLLVQREAYMTLGKETELGGSTQGQLYEGHSSDLYNKALENQSKVAGYRDHAPSIEDLETRISLN
jgi:hypothetical protein